MGARKNNPNKFKGKDQPKIDPEQDLQDFCKTESFKLKRLRGASLAWDISRGFMEAFECATITYSNEKRLWAITHNCVPEEDSWRFEHKAPATAWAWYQSLRKNQ